MSHRWLYGLWEKEEEELELSIGSSSVSLSYRAQMLICSLATRYRCHEEVILLCWTEAFKKNNKPKTTSPDKPTSELQSSEENGTLLNVLWSRTPELHVPLFLLSIWFPLFPPPSLTDWRKQMSPNWHWLPKSKSKTTLAPEQSA